MTAFRSDFVSANDLRIHHVRAGSGVPLVLLHGWPEFWLTWKPLMERLAERFELIAPDLRGFGRTDKSGAGPSDRAGAEVHAADVLGLLDALGLERVGLVSHDVGAYVAQVLARRHPERLLGLFFFDCPYPGIGRRWADAGHLIETWYQYFNQMPWAAEVVGASRDACRTYIGHFLRHWAHDPHTFDADLEVWVDAFMEPGNLQGGFDWYLSSAAARAAVIRGDAVPRPRITVPARVLWGERDPILRVEWIDRLPDEFADVAIATVPDAGHFVHYERPDRAAREIAAFFTDPDKGRRARAVTAEPREGLRVPSLPARPLSDPLWVPLLTHYEPRARGAVDTRRMAAQVRALRPYVAQFLIAGSTGDGWLLDDAQLDTLLELAATDAFDAGTRLLLGCLRPTTEGVVDRIHRVEEWLARHPFLAERVAGVAVCPPVDPQASRHAVLAHYTTVFARTRLPVAVYELPQVTGCRLAPETLATLIACGRPVAMFKDSGGEDRVAAAGLDYGRVPLLRGAEGAYVAMVQPAGPYDGWLLSTGNGFPTELRRMADLVRVDRARASEVSDRLSRVVERLFACARAEGVANAFAAVNRALDHVRAHGQAWRRAPPPVEHDGTATPPALLAAAHEALSETEGVPPVGYLAASDR